MEHGLRMFLLDELNDDDNDDVQQANANLIVVEELLGVNYGINRGDQRPVRNLEYFEVIVPLYSLDEFRDRFRMTRQTMEELVFAVGGQLGGRHKVPLRKKVMVAVWVLSKGESFADIGDRFNLSAGTVHAIFKQICNTLATLKDTYIIWPNGQEREAIAREFERKSNGIPGVVGAIDGCHIQIKAPVQNAHDFYNRKQVHSVNLQAVCNHKLQFINVFAGMPGRVHDARVFRLSPLFRELTGNEPLLPAHMHLIGDAAYPLMPCIMTPFRNNGHLTQRQIYFNNKLSSIRSTIERAFGMLKGKLRRLKYLDMSNAEDVPNIIVAACVLHNFMLLSNEEQEWWRNGEGEEENGDVENDEGNNDHEQDDIHADARVKRDYIVSVL